MRNKNESAVTKVMADKQKGFTLIELLVVIAIIGLLASVVLLALNSARAKSRDAKRLADLRQLASAYELYFNDKSAYPTAGVSASLVANTWVTLTTANSALSPTYIGLIPSAPTPADGTCTTTNPYQYSNAGGAGAVYEVRFCLGDITGGYPAGDHFLSPSGIR